MELETFEFVPAPGAKVEDRRSQNLLERMFFLAHFAGRKIRDRYHVPKF
jgi:hypothetical protein